MITWKIKQKTNKKRFHLKMPWKKIGNYGKYAALTALGTYVLLNSKKAQAASPDNPGVGF